MYLLIYYNKSRYTKLTLPSKCNRYCLHLCVCVFYEEDDSEVERYYTDETSQYRYLCEQLGIIPCSTIIRQLKKTWVNLSYSQMTSSDIRAFSTLLIVSTTNSQYIVNVTFYIAFISASIFKIWYILYKGWVMNKLPIRSALIFKIYICICNYHIFGHKQLYIFTNKINNKIFLI